MKVSSLGWVGWGRVEVLITLAAEHSTTQTESLDIPASSSIAYMTAGILETFHTNIVCPWQCVSRLSLAVRKSFVTGRSRPFCVNIDYNYVV